MKSRKEKWISIVLLITLIISLSSCTLATQLVGRGKGSQNPLISQNPSHDPFAINQELDLINTTDAFYVANLNEFFSHVEDCLQKRHRSIFLRASSYEYFGELEALNKYNLKTCYRTVYSGSNGIYYAIYEIEYYPGDNVYYAYSVNDKSLLNQNEQKIYTLAVNFIESNMSKDMSDFDKELIIHDYICNTLAYQKYGTDSNDEYNITGSYSLITGRANCQGYTDAFYMLANMTGLKCEKVAGEAEGIAHTWNIVEIEDNWVYVDVTFDDTAFDEKEIIFYAYFNAPKEYMDKSHIFYDYQTLRESISYEYFYYKYKRLAVFDEQDFTQNVYLPLAQNATEIEVFIMSEDIQPMLDMLKELNMNIQLNYFIINGCTLLAINVLQ